MIIFFIILLFIKKIKAVYIKLVIIVIILYIFLFLAFIKGLLIVSATSALLRLIEYKQKGSHYVD